MKIVDSAVFLDEDTELPDCVALIWMNDTAEQRGHTHSSVMKISSHISTSVYLFSH